MNTGKKDKLRHDFINSVVIIKSLSKSASTIIDKVSDKDIMITDNQMKLFKDSMSLIQQELTNIEKYFYTAMSE